MKTSRQIISHHQRILTSLAYIRSKTDMRPRCAIILGSGLGDVVGRLTDEIIIPARRIPYYPQSTVQGHGGNIVFGKLDTAPVLLFQGRIHFYETGDLTQSLYPIHTARALGITTLLLTNAAGGINKNLHAGDLMVLTDQINLSFENPVLKIPLTSSNNSLYAGDLVRLILSTGKNTGIALRKGIYCGVQGPSYETAAEIKMIRRIGGDAVGMSTVNEASLAAALGMQVGGISCITNLATGISNQKLSHKEVTIVARRVKSDFTKLLSEIIRHLHTNGQI